MTYINIGKETYIDVKTAPHILIAGSTGSGKSVCMNTIICELLKKDPIAEYIFIDIKRVELSPYKKIKQCVDYCNTAAAALECIETLHACMIKRYAIMERYGYRQYIGKSIYLFIDEYADISTDPEYGKQFQKVLASVARLGRAANIHIILATQYPTRDIINTQIKINIPTRICFKISRIGSIVVLDKSGAEKLTGSGHGIMIDSYGNKIEFHGKLTSDTEINRIISDNLPIPEKKKTIFERLNDYLIA